MSMTLFACAATTSYLSSQFTLAYAATTLPECKPPDCEYVIYEKLHPKERDLLNSFSPSFYEKYFGDAQHFNNFEGSPEYLRFRKDDPREKFLFLTAHGDEDIECVNPKLIASTLQDINKQYDLKYKVIKSYEEMCEEVDQASKIGKLSNLVLHRKCWISKCSDLISCFKGLDLSGKITFLDSHAVSTTLDPETNNTIVQEIATMAKRTIVAPTSSLCTKLFKVSETNGFEMFQHERTVKNFFKNIVGSTTVDSSNNVFKIFNPIYKDCVNIFKNKIHAREQAAINVVKKATASKSILVQPDEFNDLQDLLRFCKDDPKQKFLYLSMEADKSGALQPKYVSQILEPLSKEYDLKFKLIKSYDELCREIKEATESGKLTNIVIDGHGHPEAIHISGLTEPMDHTTELIHKYKDLAKCFEGADLSKITLFSCTTAAPWNGDPKNNIAHKIADATKVTVVAPLESISGTNTKLTSLNPFEVYHPSECDQYGRCKSDIDTFQTIESKKKP